MRRPVRHAHLVLLALLVLTMAVGSRVGVAAPVAADAPVPAASYRMDVTVNLAAGTAQVGQTVRLRNVVGTPLQSLVFRSPATADGSLSLGSVLVAGQPVAPRSDGSILELPLARHLAPGASVDVDLTFTLQFPNTPGRLAKTPRGITMGYWFPMLTVHRGEWDRRPFVDVGDATFSEVASFDVSVTTSEPAVVVATGDRVEQDGRRSRFIGSSVRDFALAISPEYTLRRAQVGDLTLDVAAFGEERAAYYATRGAELLTWAAARFGPLPYATVTVADADLPSSYGGLEYPGLILLARGYGLPADPAGSALDSLYLHELLHQWFYSVVGNDQIADPWLDEAFVTYLTYAYYREQTPTLAPAVYERTIAGGSSGAVDSTVYEFPSDGPYFGVVYRRGARFLEALHERLGNAAFWQVLREHVDTHRDRVATPRAFLERAQAASTTSLNPLIMSYVGYGAYRSATPLVWSVDAPDGPWTGTASLFVAADFPVTRVQALLDSRILADGPSNNLRLDLAGVEVGQYVLLVRVFDHENVLFERTRRIEISR